MAGNLGLHARARARRDLDIRSRRPRRRHAFSRMNSRDDAVEPERRGRPHRDCERNDQLACSGATINLSALCALIVASFRRPHSPERSKRPSVVTRHLNWSDDWKHLFLATAIGAVGCLLRPRPTRLAAKGQAQRANWPVDRHQRAAQAPPSGPSSSPLAPSPAAATTVRTIAATATIHGTRAITAAGRTVTMVVAAPA